MKVRNLLLGGAAIATLLAPKVLGAQDKNPKITGSISTGAHSHYIPQMGYVLGKGPHQQSSAEVNFDGLTFFNWSSYDFGNREMSEIDVGVEYAKDIGNLSTSLGYAYWHYPSEDDDQVLLANIGGGKNLEKKLSLVYLMKDKEVPNAIALKGDVSKTFEHGNGFSSNVSLSSAYLNNFYRDTGVSHVTPGATLNYEEDGFNVSGSLNYQFGFIDEPKMLPPARSQLYGNIKLEVDF